MSEASNVVWLGFAGSARAGLGSGVGALGVFLIRELSARMQDVLLSVAAGIMLAATFFSLMLPGIEHGIDQTGSKTAAVAVVIGGLLLGAVAAASR